MSVYSIAQTTRYRITLDIEALQDFDPNNIDWEKLFELQGSESCQAYVENLSDDMWWIGVTISVGVMNIYRDFFMPQNNI